MKQVRSFATPEAAEAAFYQAMAEADYAGMQGVWAAMDEIVCVHPGGPRLTGASVLESWRAIFSRGRGIPATPQAVHRLQTDELAVHSLLELVPKGDGSGYYPPVIVTNVYRRTESGWRMVLHHAHMNPRPENEGGEVHEDTAEKPGPRLH